MTARAAMGRAGRVVGLTAACLALAAPPSRAQRGRRAPRPASGGSADAGAADARQSDARLQGGRDELARARQERTVLEAQLRTLQDTAHDLRAAASGFDRQAAATARLVGALDRQLAGVGAEVEAAGARYDSASRELARQQVGLRRRLVEIYKRGPLAEAEALLSAASFGDLVARYKYLHELARRDRLFVRRVETLRNDVAAQRALLVRLQVELARNRDEKSAEETRLRAFEAQRGRSAELVEGRAARTRGRIAQIARDEARLSSLLAGIEAARRKREAAERAATARTILAREAAAREAARREAARSVAATTRSTPRSGASRPNDVVARTPEPAPAPLPSLSIAAPAPAAPAASAAAAPTSFSWPLRGPLLYRYGRVVGTNNTATRWNGVGISAPAGTPVRAAATGTVAVAQSIGSYGPTVILQHPNGDYSVYGSLARVDVQVGDAVQRGQVLGAVGSADPDLPAHLHFELRPGGRAADPLGLLGGR